MSSLSAFDKANASYNQGNTSTGAANPPVQSTESSTARPTLQRENAVIIDERNNSLTAFDRANMPLNQSNAPERAANPPNQSITSTTARPPLPRGIATPKDQGIYSVDGLLYLPPAGRHRLECRACMDNKLYWAQVQNGTLQCPGAPTFALTTLNDPRISEGASSQPPHTTSASGTIQASGPSAPGESASLPTDVAPEPMITVHMQSTHDSGPRLLFLPPISVPRTEGGWTIDTSARHTWSKWLESPVTLLPVEHRVTTEPSTTGAVSLLQQSPAAPGSVASCITEPATPAAISSLPSITGEPRTVPQTSSNIHPMGSVPSRFMMVRSKPAAYIDLTQEDETETPAPAPQPTQPSAQPAAQSEADDGSDSDVVELPGSPTVSNGDGAGEPPAKRRRV